MTTSFLRSVLSRKKKRKRKKSEPRKDILHSYELGTVKWWVKNETGSEKYWSYWHYLDPKEGYPEKTLCGRDVPKGDDYIITVDYSDSVDLTCESCYRAFKANETLVRKHEEKERLDKRVSTLVDSTTITPFAYGSFTMAELKEHINDVDGRKLAKSLKRLGWYRSKSGLWYRTEETKRQYLFDIYG